MRRRTIILFAAVASALWSAPLEAQATETAVPVGGAAPTAGPGHGPNGATLRCRDGSFPPAGAPDSACEGRGGVLARYPSRAIPPAAPATTPQSRAAQPARTALPADSAPAGFTPWRDRQARAAAESRATRVPEGATLRCTDGSYVLRDTSSARCAGRGGVQVRFVPLAPGSRSTP